jgi:1-deoxy-D-xylulose-5-phosphate synthase
VKPIDTDTIYEVALHHNIVVTMEENVASGGFGEKVRKYIDSYFSDTMLINVTIPDEYVEHGNVDILRKEVEIDADSIVKRILELV